MRIHGLQHVSYEGLGEIENWGRHRGHEVVTSHLYRGERLPDPNQVDWLFVMGGPMNVDDVHLYPWLKKEKVFLEEMMDRGTIIVGICLGAQLLAEVLGAEVGTARNREIGWFPVTLTPDASDANPLESFPSRFPAFHFHGDAFQLPASARSLASTEACENQAFVYGDRVVALQFHLEMDRTGIRKLLDSTSMDRFKGPFVQSREEILAFRRVAESQSVFHLLLSNLERLDTT